MLMESQLNHCNYHGRLYADTST